jgi:hypothetical protein
VRVGSALAISWATLVLVCGCGEKGSAQRTNLPSIQGDFVATAASASAAPTLSPEQLTCARDEGCAFDPVTGQCGNDPRYNHQPALVDQGLVCYCDAGHCGTLRVWPVPCESDSSCAVSLSPRPHPIAASEETPHERGKRCRDYKYATTCERTNICTMHVLDCR